MSNRQHLVSWDEIQEFTRQLASRQLPAEQWRGIIAVSRGGLIPGALMARELNLRLVDSVCVSSYEFQEQKSEPMMLKDVSVTDNGEGFLVVDDLVDSGNTLKFLRKRFPKAKFVTVYAKPAGIPMVDEYIADIAQDTWIHFPWDMQMQYIEPLSGPET